MVLSLFIENSKVELSSEDFKTSEVTFRQNIVGAVSSTPLEMGTSTEYKIGEEIYNIKINSIKKVPTVSNYSETTGDYIAVDYTITNKGFSPLAYIPLDFRFYDELNSGGVHGIPYLMENINVIPNTSSDGVLYFESDGSGIAYLLNDFSSEYWILTY